MASKGTPTIIDLMSDPAFLGGSFQSKSWSAWRIFLKGLFCMSFSPSELSAFQQFTGRTRPPAAAREGWLVVGRRGGKSAIAALVGLYLAAFRDYTPYLAPGEYATVMTIASDRRQASIVLDFIRGYLATSPMLGQLVTRTTRDGIELRDSVRLEVHTASFRSTRGYTLAGVICDEIAFWRDERFANPDTEILNALRPGMATIPGSLLLCISSPYSRTGELWKAFRRFYGQSDDNVLVWKATSRQMNPTLSEQTVKAALERDPVAARAEYLAEFRTDVESLISLEALEEVVVPGRRELPPVKDFPYFAFTDPSGGSHDSFTLAVAHREDQTVILDALRERKPPFSPEAVTQEFSQLLKSYCISRVMGDRYAGQWCQQAFQKNGIQYIPAKKSKSEIYLNFLPLLNSGNVRLLDHPRLSHQLQNLERRTSRAGRESVDHGPGGHDDVANAATGALVVAAENRKRKLTWGRGSDHLRNRLPNRDYLPHMVHSVVLSKGGRK